MSDDRIDTRDLVDELAALEAGRECILTPENMATEDDCTTHEHSWADEDDEERATAITALFEEISGYAGDSPEDGVILIAEDDFQTYAQELAEDIGAIDSEGGWPTYCIDWEWAARELAMDYTSVTFDGRDYYYR